MSDPASAPSAGLIPQERSEVPGTQLRGRLACVPPGTFSVLSEQSLPWSSRQTSQRVPASPRAAAEAAPHPQGAVCEQSLAR